jgi:hypothetical protein
MGRLPQQAIDGRMSNELLTRYRTYGSLLLDAKPTLANEGNDFHDRQSMVAVGRLVIGPIVDLPCRTTVLSQESTVQWGACPYRSQQTCEPVYCYLDHRGLRLSKGILCSVDVGYAAAAVSTIQCPMECEFVEARGWEDPCHLEREWHEPIQFCTSRGRSWRILQKSHRRHANCATRQPLFEKEK